MDMEQWAKEEIKLALKQDQNKSLYAKACFDSAFTAFKSLLGDDHSGASIQITKQILTRLIDGKPLTPLTDDKGEWTEVSSYFGDIAHYYQNKRCSSVFKEISNDGTVRFKDINRYVMMNGESGTWYSGLIDILGYEMFPIEEMPYMPANKPYIFHGLGFKADDNHNGDFDTIGIFDVVNPFGDKIVINRYFRDPVHGEKETYPGWVEIDKEEYDERYARKIE